MTTDKRITETTKDMNYRQEKLFIQHVEMIANRGWTWKKAMSGQFHVFDSDQTLIGQGVTLVHAFQEAESAK